MTEMPQGPVQGGLYPNNKVTVTRLMWPYAHKLPVQARLYPNFTGASPVISLILPVQARLYPYFYWCKPGCIPNIAVQARL